MPLNFRGTTLRQAMGLTLTITMASKSIGYIRQLLMAYYFGVSRQLDIYFMAFGITQLVIFSINSLFEQVALPHLVREKDGDAKDFKNLASTVFSWSFIIAAVSALLLFLIYPLVSWMMAHGFTPQEKGTLRQTSYTFYPLILVSCPAVALSAILRSTRFYGAPLAAELAASAVSTAFFFFWHPSPQVLPLSLAAGTATAFVILFLFAREHLLTSFRLGGERVRVIFRQFCELFVANQFGSLTTVVDRFYQSYLSAGSISVFNYVTSTLNPLNELILFKESYVVPLSSDEDRSRRLGRLLSGILYLTIPMAVFLCIGSPLIIQILYQRGKFGANVAAETAVIFSIMAFTLITGSLGAPLLRMFQIIDRIRYSGFVYGGSVLGLAVLNFFAIFILNLDIKGFAIAMALNSMVMLAFEIFLLRQSGLQFDWGMLGRMLGFSMFASAVAGTAAGFIPTPFPAFFSLGIKAVIFGGIIAVFYWTRRTVLFQVLYGQ